MKDDHEGVWIHGRDSGGDVGGGGWKEVNGSSVGNWPNLLLGSLPFGFHFAVPQQAEPLLLWKRN